LAPNRLPGPNPVRKAELIIETPFELTVLGQTFRLDSNERAGLGPFAGLHPDTAADVLMSRGGELVVTFLSVTRSGVLFRGVFSEL